MYKLVVLDFMLPKIDGPRAARMIKKRLQDEGLPAPFFCCTCPYAEVPFKECA